MHSEKDIIELIKETYPLKPREEFVLNTEEHLKRQARKKSRGRVMKQSLFAISGLIVCIIALSIFFVFSEKEGLLSTVNSTVDGTKPIVMNEEEAAVFIYHSHNTETYVPNNTNKDAGKATHETENITLIGERLNQELKERNISAIHNKSDISEIMKDRELYDNKSYTVSREALQNALEKNKNIKMALDIHRGVSEYKMSTINLEGKSYAKIALIVSNSSAKFRGNKKFADLLHKKIETKYPGLSGGVIIQTTGNTYNQDLLGESVLLEIGGQENEWKEAYASVEALAEVIKEIIEIETE